MSWISILEAIPATWKKKLRENELLNTECQEIPSSRCCPLKLPTGGDYDQLLRSQPLRKLLAGF